MTIHHSAKDTTSTDTTAEVVGMSTPATAHPVIDDAAKHRFTHGQCHAFAWELAQATGWDVAALIEESCCFSDDLDECASDDVYPGVCGCQLEHVVCVRPDGKLVDINGVHNPGEVTGLEGWEMIPVDEDLWKYILNWGVGQAPDMEAARPYVAALLAQLGEDEGDEEGEGGVPAAPSPTGPVFPGVLQAGETVRPYTEQDVTTTYDRVKDGVDWVVTTVHGDEYRLTEAYDGWQVGRAPFHWSVSNGGYFWWAELDQDHSLAAALNWVRGDSASQAWAAGVWERYGHMNDERVQWSPELVETELEPRVVRVERYGRVGITAKYRWGWERSAGGAFAEAGSGGNVDGAFFKRQAYYLTIEGLTEIPTDRWRIVAADAPHARDAIECGPGGWEHGGCRARKTSGRFLIDILAEDGQAVMGRIGACAEHLAGRLAADLGHIERPYETACKLSLKTSGKWGSWVEWRDRFHQLTAELLTAALAAGEVNPRPDVVAALYAQALGMGEAEAGKLARKTAREAGAKREAQLAAGEAAVAERRARRADLLAAAGRGREARYRPAPVAVADISLAA